MRSFCLNHMTTPSMSFQELVRTAAAIGCSGIEVRNDLHVPLFDGLAPEEARIMANEQGVRIFAVAEVAAFNDGSSRALNQLSQLADIAARCGANGVSLIPAVANDVDSAVASAAEIKSDNEAATVAQLSDTLTAFAPVLAKHRIIGYIEPLGFKRASLRFKAHAVAAIKSIKASGYESPFELVHDTFHHHVANELTMFPELTGMVHVSGVVPVTPTPEELDDAHRGLVTKEDTLGNLEQLTQLIHGGYKGPVSIEAFAPAVHNLQDPKEALLTCLNHIGPSTQVVAA